MEGLSSLAEQRGTLDWHLWMEAATKLNALLEPEQHKKFELESRLAKMKAAYLEEGQTAAYAKSMVEAQDEWLEYKKQSALVDRAIETIRLAKKHATLSKEIEWSGQFAIMVFLSL